MTKAEASPIRQEIANLDSHAATLRTQMRSAEAELTALERKRDALRSLLKGEPLAAPAEPAPSQP